MMPPEPVPPPARLDDIMDDPGPVDGGLDRCDTTFVTGYDDSATGPTASGSVVGGSIAGGLIDGKATWVGEPIKAAGPTALTVMQNVLITALICALCAFIAYAVTAL
jgi:hypothetical protein